MRLEIPRYTERFGAVRIHEVLKVLELDSGPGDEEMPGLAVKRIPEALLAEVESQTAIVIPIRNEPLHLFEGVLSGIPHRCPIIVISNSDRDPVDRLEVEEDTFSQYCYFTQRKGVLIHQRDPELAKAISAAGYTDLLDEDGLVRKGKAEGMILGIFIARMLQAQHVGFIDSDNYFPGSVWEYCRIYAAGLALARTPYAMVRVLWRFKPKATSDERIVFKRYGRVSERTNRFLNRLMSTNTGFESEIIRTANAGEHALTMRLAELLPISAGFGVEPFHFTSLFKRFGALLPTNMPEVIDKGIDVFQIESRNPHMHENKGDAHVRDMAVEALATIFHSELCGPELRHEIMATAVQEGLIQEGDAIQAPRVYPPLGPFLDSFMELYAGDLERHYVPAGGVWQSL
ncbi:MAG: mannosyl-3-phosphoglycerate synthase [Acidobacteria bacterium]|nr:mannosyl-3-phosphoglycerate synthase [Acidobacteriota bacterium]